MGAVKTFLLSFLVGCALAGPALGIAACEDRARAANDECLARCERLEPAGDDAESGAASCHARCSSERSGD